jgi:hypothetical protein
MAIIDLAVGIDLGATYLANLWVWHVLLLDDFTNCRQLRTSGGWSSSATSIKQAQQWV